MLRKRYYRRRDTIGCGVGHLLYRCGFCGRCEEVRKLIFGSLYLSPEKMFHFSIFSRSYFIAVDSITSLRRHLTLSFILYNEVVSTKCASELYIQHLLLYFSAIATSSFSSWSEVHLGHVSTLRIRHFDRNLYVAALLHFLYSLSFENFP